MAHGFLKLFPQKLLGIWNFFIHRILLVFFIIFNIVNIGCIFGACDNIYNGGSNNISKFIAKHFVYDNIDFDYERIKYSNNGQGLHSLTGCAPFFVVGKHMLRVRHFCVT